MREVKLQHVKPNDVIDIVLELKQLGWQQGVDFDWTYYQPLFDPEWNLAQPRQTVFTFYNEKYATWFALRYS